MTIVPPPVDLTHDEIRARVEGRVLRALVLSVVLVAAALARWGWPS